MTVTRYSIALSRYMHAHVALLDLSHRPVRLDLPNNALGRMMSFWSMLSTPHVRARRRSRLPDVSRKFFVYMRYRASRGASRNLGDAKCQPQLRRYDAIYFLPCPPRRRDN